MQAILVFDKEQIHVTISQRMPARQLAKGIYLSEVLGRLALKSATLVQGTYKKKSILVSVPACFSTSKFIEHISSFECKFRANLGFGSKQFIASRCE